MKNSVLKSEDDKLTIDLATKDKHAKNKKDEVQVTVSIECERQLQKVLSQINSEDEAIRITRKQLLNYIISQSSDNFSDQDIIAVRRANLNDMTLWDKLNREIKQTGVVPDALKEFLWKMSNLEIPVKPGKKPRHSKYISDIHKDEVVSESRGDKTNAG